jgi:succinoglycan biosynthesis protein ExoM
MTLCVFTHERYKNKIAALRQSHYSVGVMRHKLNSSAPIDAAKVVIGVCTCRNPLGLLTTINALDRHKTDHDVTLLVVENDSAQAGLDALASCFGARPVVTVFAENPGIPFARNRLIEKALTFDPDYIVMIDDDEEPCPDWLNRMVETQRTTGATCVGGGVIPIFESALPGPLIHSDFTKSRPIPLGERTCLNSTANVLFDAGFFASWGSTWFDESLRFTGGSDAEFFRRMFNAGHLFAFNDTAHVAERIEQNRATTEWMFKRSVRIGFMKADRALRDGSFSARRAVFFEAAVHILRPLLPWRLFSARDRYLGRRRINIGRGIFLRLMNRKLEEYHPSIYRAQQGATAETALVTPP